VDQETVASLIARARKGDHEAFEAVVNEHQEQLNGYIRGRIGAHLRGRLDPADVFQDTLLHGFRSIAHFTWRGGGSFRRWLEAIAEHRIRDALRGAKAPRDFQLDRGLPASDISPSRGARRNERFDRLQGALERLSPDHQQVILLCRIQGLKISEVAQRMQRSESAVKSLLLRALRELKTSFGDTESLHLPDKQLSGGRGADDGD